MKNLSDREFHRIVNFIKSNYGIDLGKKKHLIEGRLTSLIAEKGCDSFDDFFSHMLKQNSKEELTDLISRLTTNHTFFMREAEHFLLFEQKVLPWMEKAASDRDLRIWSAGCSSGEEPYTLAMILADYFDQDKRTWEKKILATDISRDVLYKARQGIYKAEAAKELKRSWQYQYFNQLGNGTYQVKEQLKKEVIFRCFNLMEEFPFRRRFHTIFCRNVMIYFDQETKDSLMQKFYDSLEPGGYLFIGMSETLDKHKIPYEYVMPSVYRKGRGV